jgi:hypothetical protein
LAERTEYAPDPPEEQETLDYLGMLDQRPQPATITTTVGPEIRTRFLAEHQTFLRELHDNPSASVTEHYRRLQWGAGRGNRVKNQLLEMGLIVIARQRSTAGRPVEILLLTDAAKELLNESAH